MENSEAVACLSALAHAGRLEALRTLVRAGRAGLPAGRLAEALNVAPNTLSAQLNALSGCGLVDGEREGRSIIYRACLPRLSALMLYLVEECCEGRDEVCLPLMDAIQMAEC